VKKVADGIWAVTGGAFPSNSFICQTGRPGEAILIDAGLDPVPIELAFQHLSLRPTHVFCTHGHFDHIGSADFFQTRYGVPVHLHPADTKIARSNNFMLMAMKMAERIRLPELTPVNDGSPFAFDAATLRYRSTPGHTPGSCILEWGTHLFTGDTIFASGVGLSKLPGEDQTLLRQSIEAAWDDLARFTLHPGHGSSGAGAQIKRDNVRLRAFLAQNENAAS
jgi:glyoxylase-like metal-dependent hydrolase (beta-lactamase superfamily II)